MLLESLLIVCLPPGTTGATIGDELGRRLAPFDATRPGPRAPRPVLAPNPHSFVTLVMHRIPHNLNVQDPALSWAQVADVFNGHLDRCGLDPLTTPRLFLDADGQPYGVTTANPNGKFWSWRIGGPRGGHFHADRDDHRELIGAQSSLLRAELRCDGGPIRCLALARMRQLAGAAASEMFGFWEQAVMGTPPARLPADLVAQRRTVPDYSLQRTTAEYRAQPRVIALAFADLAEAPLFYDRDDPAGYDNALASFQPGRARFIAHHFNAAPLGTAFLTLDGNWLDSAFGTVDATVAGLVNAGRRYIEQATAYLNGLDPDTVLAAVELE